MGLKIQGKLNVEILDFVFFRASENFDEAAPAALLKSLFGHEARGGGGEGGGCAGQGVETIGGVGWRLRAQGQQCGEDQGGGAAARHHRKSVRRALG